MRYQSILILLVFSLLFAGCKIVDKTRGYYDLEWSEYDYDKAVKQLLNLKKGVLIVAIPTEKHKLRLLRNTDIEKYNETIEELHKNKEIIISSMSKFYKYSDYVIIPDSSLVRFTKYNESQHFLSEDGMAMPENEIDTSLNYFVLKSLRDSDHFFIYDKNNNFPYRPFPYTSTLRIGENINPSELYEKIPKAEDRNYINEALFIISKKLDQKRTY